jgi:uncharacterized protein DUF5924
MSSGAAPAAGGSRFERVIRKLWWLHSCWALVFGIGVMACARKGLGYPDKLLVCLVASWVLIFVALRFIVGRDHTSPGDGLPKKGLRLVTNYFIKNLYQQMFFFLVPFYFTSTTWSLESTNWWLAPILIGCAVLSTMDLVMDNFVMQHRNVAAVLYGVCLFAVLNLVLPIAFRLTHARALLIALGATPVTVASLTFRLRAVVSPRGLGLVAAATAALLVAGRFAPGFVPPAPLVMVRGAVSHGTAGSREVVGEHHEVIPATELDGLRCGTLLVQPGGIHDTITHVWRHHGATWRRLEPTAIPYPFADGTVLRSQLADLPPDPTGDWSCSAWTADGQLVGRVHFRIAPAPTPAPPAPTPAPPPPTVTALAP